jgi:Mg-chelatase subunit ChlD
MLAAVCLILSGAAIVATETTEPVRTVPVAVYTKALKPVEDLAAAEVSLKEDGATRKVLGVERDHERVDIALILDSSASMGNEYRSSLVAAAMAFWEAAPEEARVSVWTSGGRPSKVVDFGTEHAAAEAAISQVAIGGPSFTLDAMIGAARDLQKERGRRRVEIVVTDYSMPATRTLIQSTYRMMAQARVTPMIVLVKTGAVRGGATRIGGEGQSFDNEAIFERMADRYGGSYKLVLTAQASHKLLTEMAADLGSQYRVSYTSNAEQPTRPEVRIKRKDVEVRVGLSEGSR